jgi:hypothetical protein
VRHAAQLDATPARWERQARQLGADQAEWYRTTQDSE